MSTPTYDLIEHQVLSSNTATVTIGSGGTLNQNYRHLFIMISGFYSTTGSNIRYRFNGDSGSNYSYTQLYTSGTTVASARSGSLDSNYARGMKTTETSIIKIMIPSYSSTNMWKTSRNDGATIDQYDAFSNTWRNTAAVTSISFGDFGGTGVFSAGTIFSVWGLV